MSHLERENGDLAFRAAVRSASRLFPEADSGEREKILPDLLSLYRRLDGLLLAKYGKDKDLVTSFGELDLEERSQVSWFLGAVAVCGSGVSEDEIRLNMGKVENDVDDVEKAFGDLTGIIGPVSYRLSGFDRFDWREYYLQVRFLEHQVRTGVFTVGDWLASFSGICSSLLEQEQNFYAFLGGMFDFRGRVNFFQTRNNWEIKIELHHMESFGFLTKYFERYLGFRPGYHERRVMPGIVGIDDPDKVLRFIEKVGPWLKLESRKKMVRAYLEGNSRDGG